MTNYFARYDKKKSRQEYWVLSWINGKDWRIWRKEYLMTYDYMLDGVLDKIKMLISIEKFDDTKILIDIEDKLADKATCCYTNFLGY